MRCIFRFTLLLCLLLFFLQPAFAQAGAGEPKLQLPQVELMNRWLECSKKSIALSQLMQAQTQQLLKAADAFDVEVYRKADDELADSYEKLDANYLESGMIAEALSLSEAERANARQLQDTTAEALKTAKAFSDKSSAIFYLCFGLPVQSSHYSRLALSLVEANPKSKVEKAPLLFYAGAASFWSAEYPYAEEQLKKSLELDPNQHYAPYYLGELYLAEKQTTNGIVWLNAAKERCQNDELKGHLNRSLALAYTLTKQPKLARACIEDAKRELSTDKSKEFPFIARESLGVVETLAGNYREAEKVLSEALPGLQASPIKLGNRLEAAQTALWRSYCRHKLGNAAAAAEDRQYALSFADEATHLLTLAQSLDPVFAYKEPAGAVDRIPEKWAIVVGVGSFADPAVPQLRYPAKDAKDMENFLTHSAGFQTDHVKLLVNSDASRDSIVDCLAGKWLPVLAHPGDLIVLFVSSHGTPAYKDIGALNSIVTYDTQLEHLFSTSLPMQSIVRIMRSKLKKQHAFVVLDTCYAGGLGAPGDAARADANVSPELMVISKRQLMLSSSDSTQRSWESRRYKNSVFTRQLVDTLEKHPAYEDFHTIFTEIAEKVNQEVTADFKHAQTPRLAGAWNGRGLMNQPQTANAKHEK